MSQDRHVTLLFSGEAPQNPVLNIYINLYIKIIETIFYILIMDEKVLD